MDGSKQDKQMPHHLPTHSVDLVDELDELNPPVVLSGPIQEGDIQQLVYLAGRRSLVDELIRAKNAPRAT